jgi:ribA/ribD-fused uncharacterized protein
MQPIPPSRRLADLLDAEAADRSLDMLAFYGPHPGADGALSPSCLNQGYPRSFTVDDADYTTAEQWMMAGKAQLFGDAEALAGVLATPDPVLARSVGERVRGVDLARWYNIGYGIVVQGNLAKFSQHKDLRDYLLSTGEQVLVHADPYDPVWGIGLALGDPNLRRPSRWPGLNYLGFALMDVRERLLDGEELR